LSIRFFDEGKSIGGDDEMVTGGYQKIVQDLLKGVTILFNTTITAIDYS